VAVCHGYNLIVVLISCKTITNKLQARPLTTLPILFTATAGELYRKVLFYAI
jgi:hypothetical protein